MEIRNMIFQIYKIYIWVQLYNIQKTLGLLKFKKYK